MRFISLESVMFCDGKFPLRLPLKRCFNQVSFCLATLVSSVCQQISVIWFCTGPFTGDFWRDFWYDSSGDFQVILNRACVKLLAISLRFCCDFAVCTGTRRSQSNQTEQNINRTLNSIGRLGCSDRTKSSRNFFGSLYYGTNRTKISLIGSILFYNQEKTHQ